MVSTSTDGSIDVYSLGNPSPALSLATTDFSKQHVWSPLSGKQLASLSTNIVSLCDPRSSTTATSTIETGYQATRPSNLSFLDDENIIVTGTTPSRQRSLKLYDLRNPSTPKHAIPFDQSSSPSISLTPLIDSTRRLAYLIQTHSSSIFAFDFNDPRPVPTTLMVPSTIVGAGMLPPTEVDVMKGEINRLFVLTGRDEIVPVSVRIERKSYMDFHGDLFPDVFVPGVGIEGKEWLDGLDETREKVSLDPEKQGWRQKETSAAIQSDLSPRGPTPSTSQPQATSIDTTTSITPTETTWQTETSAPPSTTEDVSITPPSPPAQLAPLKPIPTPTPPTSYTRKFLTGTLHHPSKHYTSLPSLPSTPSHRLLDSTSTHLSFPIAGGGAQLSILSISSPGRQTQVKTITNGSPLVDFMLCRISPQVATAGEDGWIKVFTIEGDEFARFMLEKVVQIEWHPLAEGLLGVLGVQHGKTVVLAWDVLGETKLEMKLDYTV